MYDILEALKWVNKNIGAFGGDPNQVTLAGQSSGAVAIGMFCVSPLAKGLFKRIIMESGSPANILYDNNTSNLYKSQKIAEEVGCADEDTTVFDDPDKVVDCMRGMYNVCRIVCRYVIVVSFSMLNNLTFYIIFLIEVTIIKSRTFFFLFNFQNIL